jgi:putative transposase
MLKGTTVVGFRQPDAIDDPLTELAREGARRMLAQALVAEADAFVALWKGSKLPDGRDRVVRHGHGPHRAIQTGVGPVEVRRAKVRDRGEVGAEEKIRFTSSILPKWARRTKSLDALLPVLYLRGVSTGDFQEALTALLGKAAPNLSPAVISRLTAEWQADYDAWQNRELLARRYVYVWADGVYLQARMEPAAECMLVLIGATPEGKKELVGFQTGVRESAQSWRELLIDIKQRGLEIAPDLAVGEPALAKSGGRAWLLEGHRGGLSGRPAPAVLGSQDRQRAEQSCPLGPAPSTWDLQIDGKRDGLSDARRYA